MHFNHLNRIKNGFLAAFHVFINQALVRIDCVGEKNEEEDKISHYLNVDSQN